MNEWRLTIEGLGRGLPDPRRLLQERMQQLDQWSERWAHSRLATFDRRRDLVANLGARLKTPGEQIAAAGAALNFAASHLDAAARRTIERHDRALERATAGLTRRVLEAMIERKAHTLEALGRLLDSYSYDQVLKRGFALVRNSDGEPVTAAAGLGGAERLSLQFHDGAVSVVTEGRSAPPKRAATVKSKPEQGSLL
jgi:exodeoxyribonuclease VII large subunit